MSKKLQVHYKVNNMKGKFHKKRSTEFYSHQSTSIKENSFTFCYTILCILAKKLMLMIFDFFQYGKCVRRRNTFFCFLYWYSILRSYHKFVYSFISHNFQLWWLFFAYVLLFWMRNFIYKVSIYDKHLTYILSFLYHSDLLPI